MHTGSSLISYEQCAIGFSKMDNGDLLTLKLYYIKYKKYFYSCCKLEFTKPINLINQSYQFI